MLKLKKWGNLFRSTAHIFFERLSRWRKRFTIDRIGRKIAQEHNKHANLARSLGSIILVLKHFYKRHGFKVVGEHHFQTGDVTDTDLIMEKEL